MNEADTVVTKLVANDWMDDELCKNIARAYALGIGVLTEEPWGIWKGVPCRWFWVHLKVAVVARYV